MCAGWGLSHEHAAPKPAPKSAPRKVGAAPGWKGLEWIDRDLPAVDRAYLDATKDPNWHVPPAPSTEEAIELTEERWNAAAHQRLTELHAIIDPLVGTTVPSGAPALPPN